MASVGKKSILGAGEAHIWLAAIDTASESLAELEPLLNRAEVSRAEKFRFERDRCRHVFSHGVLRQTLAVYSGANPREIVFEANHFGKPYLPQSPGGIAFSLIWRIPDLSPLLE